MRHTTGPARWAVLLLTTGVLAGCQDLRESFELREAVKERLGWSRAEVGLHVTEDLLEVTVTDPEDGAAAPSRESAEVVARLALDRLRRAHRVDSIRVSFATEKDFGVVGTREKRSYGFFTDSLRPAPATGRAGARP